MLAFLWLVVFISLFVAIGGKLSWLEFVTIFSYVKLAVTLIKYCPQVCVCACVCVCVCVCVRACVEVCVSVSDMHV